MLSPLAVSDEYRCSRSREREGERGWPPRSDASEVGDIDAGDEGRVESLDTDTDADETDGGECGGRGISYTTLRIFIRSAYVSCCSAGAGYSLRREGAHKDNTGTHDGFQPSHFLLLGHHASPSPIPPP